MTFDRIEYIGEAFAEGQVYVALSRVKTLDGLFLDSNFNFNTIKANKKSIKFILKHLSLKQIKDMQNLKDIRSNALFIIRKKFESVYINNSRTVEFLFNLFALLCLSLSLTILILQ
jgi:hypothetical protein